ncbi:MAG TPA: VOC family protein [Nitrososphaeraceae archaeon]|nr:VOC family protein [Nitrososphaeraceae archaeon]
MSYKIKGISLLVSDIKKTLEFYKNVLGININQKNDNTIEFSYKGSDSINFVLANRNSEENKDTQLPQNGNIMITFLINNFDEIHNNLIQKNAKVYSEATQGPNTKNVIIEDPDGYLISLVEIIPKDEFSQIPYYHGFAPE